MRPFGCRPLPVSRGTTAAEAPAGPVSAFAVKTFGPRTSSASFRVMSLCGGNRLVEITRWPLAGDGFSGVGSPLPKLLTGNWLACGHPRDARMTPLRPSPVRLRLRVTTPWRSSSFAQTSRICRVRLRITFVHARLGVGRALRPRCDPTGGSRPDQSGKSLPNRLPVRERHAGDRNTGDRHRRH